VPLDVANEPRGALRTLEPLDGELVAGRGAAHRADQLAALRAAGLVKASHRSTNSFPYPQYRTTVYRNSMSAREPLAFARSAGRQYPVIGALLLAQQQGGTRATDCLRNHAPRKPLGCDQPDRSVSVGLREGAPLPCMIARST
jgi:hypothetical protein